MTSIQIENDKYKKQCEELFKQGNFCIMRYEKQMDYLFSKLEVDLRNQKLQILDACCGYGRLLHYMNQRFSNQNYIGIDCVPTLIKTAKDLFKNNQNISLEVADILNISKRYLKKFDITINYKVLSWFPYYEECINELIKVTKHKIYITSLFNDGDFESITKIYPSASIKNTDFTYLNTYSLPKFKQYVQSCGARVIETIPMQLDFDLKMPVDINQITTYTELLQNGQRLEITANTLLNWKLVVIQVTP